MKTATNDSSTRQDAFDATVAALRAYHRHEQTCATCRGATRQRRVGARCAQGQALSQAITATTKRYERVAKGR
jgi:hypothetical protein